MYSLMQGTEPIGYPFLCNTISASLYSLGVGLRAAYIIPMLYASLGLLLSVYVFFSAWLKRMTAAATAMVLFFVGGGFGFAYFFDLLKLDTYKLSDMMTGFFTTPTNLTTSGVYWVNIIADMIIPQRATLFGWSILVPCLFLLVRALFDGRRRYFIPLGIFAGGLPLIHTHSFLALGIISMVLLILCAIEVILKSEDVQALKWLCIYGCIAVVLSAPQLFAFTFNQSLNEGFIKWHWNWVNDKDNYLWFYIKNIGIPYILMIPAFIHADWRRKKLFLAGLALLHICEFGVFQPNEYDNNKLLYIWYLLLCGLVVDFLTDIYVALRRINFRGIWACAVIAAVVMNLSGVMTLAREYKSEYILFTREHVEAAEFIKDNTAPDALFLTAENHNNTVAVLTGRNIVCGTGSFLHFHGIAYEHLRSKQHSLLLSPTMEQLLASGVDYVFVSDYEYDIDGFSEDFFAENLRLVFDNGVVGIYSVY
jgi:hypothetical protein